MRDLTPWLLVVGNCCVMPLLIFATAWWMRGQNIRIRVERRTSAATRYEDKTGPTARQIVTRQLPSQQQRREEAVGYGPTDKP